MPSWMCRRCQRLFDERAADGRCALDGGELVELAAPQVEDEHTDRVYDEKYRVGRVIGRGGMGCVHEATNLRLEQPVAIKFFSPLSGATSGLTPGGGQERFRREAVTTVRLRHANVVEVLDYAIDPDGTQYIVMERLEGSPLDEALVRGGLTVGRALEILDLVLKAVEYAHGQGVIHRDLKPGNVFLAQIAGRKSVKVLDFGIARIAELATITSGPVGTLRFAAPEQISGGRVTPSADVFSAGMLLHDICWPGPSAGGASRSGRPGRAAPPRRASDVARAVGALRRRRGDEPRWRKAAGSSRGRARAKAAASRRRRRFVAGGGGSRDGRIGGIDPPRPRTDRPDGRWRHSASRRRTLSDRGDPRHRGVDRRRGPVLLDVPRRSRAVQQDGAVAATAEDARPADERTSSATPARPPRRRNRPDRRTGAGHRRADPGPR